MAANKFATMLHRNTNKITLVLVYALLEWILIILLLLNSLFSYLIIKFADYFGLKRPCIWCNRIDHIIEPKKGKFSCGDLVCETHASEISKLSFCSNHRKLAESNDMCGDCFSSSNPDYIIFSKSLGLFPWMKQMDRIEDVADKATENGVEILKCSCCGVSLDSRFYPPCILIRPPLKVLDCSPEPNLTADDDEGVEPVIDEGDHSDHIRSDYVLDHRNDDGERNEENRGIHMSSDADGIFGKKAEEADESWGCSVCDGGRETVADENNELDLALEKEKYSIKGEILIVDGDDRTCEHNTVECAREKIDGISSPHLEFFIYGDDCSLIPIELIDSPVSEKMRNQHRYKVVDEGNSGNEDVILDFDMLTGVEAEPVIENWHTSGESVEMLSDNQNGEVSKENMVQSIEFKVSEGHTEEENWRQNYQEVKISRTTEHLPRDDNEAKVERRGIEKSSDVFRAQMQVDEIEADVSIGTEIPDHEQVDQYPCQDVLRGSNQHLQEEPSAGSVRFHVQDDSDCDKPVEEFVEFKTMSIQTNTPTTNNRLSSSAGLNEKEKDKEEDKFPETPNSLDSLHQLHQKLILLERKGPGTEESLDENVVSDIENGEMTFEKLKSTLKAERKALNTLYAELEKERCASAIAANQTMAMINRLQEEKAAMQMEALQYQRMMEEQSEYDQEALQLLNELMIKREKEKLELEKELELCRKKVLEYEAWEKMRISRRGRNTSPCCSNGEECDELSVDLNHEAKENGFHRHEDSSNKNTPVDAVIHLEESLTSFEKERLSILEQLRVLEEKLVALNYEEEQEVEQRHFDDVKSIEYHCEENGNGFHDHVKELANGHAMETISKHHHHNYDRKIVVPKAKSLLSLFDAMGTEAEDVILNSGDENGVGLHSLQDCSPGNAELDKKRLALEEEVDHVYERLQALEADREFLKHCISSLRKGDKGLYLLQEILQHLHDLKNIELEVRDIGDHSV